MKLQCARKYGYTGIQNSASCLEKERTFLPLLQHLYVNFYVCHFYFLLSVLLRRFFTSLKPSLECIGFSSSLALFHVADEKSTINFTIVDIMNQLYSVFEIKKSNKNKSTSKQFFFFANFSLKQKIKFCLFFKLLYIFLFSAVRSYIRLRVNEILGN